MHKFVAVISVVFAFGCASVDEPAEAPEQFTWADALNARISADWSSDEHRAFDFWIGEWEMNWRQRPADEFYHEADGSWTRQRVFPILGGKAIVELAWDRDKPNEPSQRGFSIRYFDAANDRWVMAQNWPNENNNGAAFLDQLVGKSHLGRLTVYSAQRRPNPDGEMAIEHRRYNFADIRPGVSFRWDGSNTADNGATWYTWYIVDAHRKRDLDPFGRAGSSFPGFNQEKLCDAEPHGSFDEIEGVWIGTATNSDGVQTKATFSAGRLLDGCGVAGVLDANGVKTFMTFGFIERHKKWVSYRLDDQPGTGHAYYVAVQAGVNAVFMQAPGLVIKDEFTIFSAPENFSIENSAHRTIWKQITENKIVFYDESRVDDIWRTTIEYEFSRAAD